MMSTRVRLETSTESRMVLALRSILEIREHELLVAKGPCCNESCALHRAHSGPCDVRG